MNGYEVDKNYEAVLYSANDRKTVKKVKVKCENFVNKSENVNEALYWQKLPLNYFI